MGRGGGNRGLLLGIGEHRLVRCLVVVVMGDMCHLLISNVLACYTNCFCLKLNLATKVKQITVFARIIAIPRIIAPFWCENRNNCPRLLFEEIR